MELQAKRMAAGVREADWGCTGHDNGIKEAILG
jgi:hypothetical protein